MSAANVAESAEDREKVARCVNAMANKLKEDTNSESLESTRRMVGMLEDSKEAGIRTLVMLDEQGEQLDGISKGMDRINQDMRDAEKNLKGMEKCCGLCVLPWRRSKDFEKDPNYKAAWAESNEDGAINSDGPRVTVGEQVQVGGQYITRLTHDAREEEMEQNMQEINSMVGNLRNMTIDMGNELDSQNRQLTIIAGQAEANQKRVDLANKRTEDLLNN